jgi:two-component system, cell cycle response regulator DivK
MPTKPVATSAPLVLVIDDAEDNREVYVQCFELQGWRTATASDGKGGLEKAATLKPNAIVLDLHLPVIDGWTVARLLKADTATKATPIIALTADAMEGAEERARAAGVDAFCTKPCSPPDLAAVIRRFLGEALRSEWKAVDLLMRELGTLRDEARGLDPALDVAITTEVDALLAAAAHAVDDTVGVPDEELRLIAACEAIVKARDAISALRATASRASIIVHRSIELRRKAARLLYDSIRAAGGQADEGR